MSKFFILVLSGVFIVNCSRNPFEIHNKGLGKVELGMSRKQVKDIMGNDLCGKTGDTLSYYSIPEEKYPDSHKKGQCILSFKFSDNNLKTISIKTFTIENILDSRRRFVIGKKIQANVAKPKFNDVPIPIKPLNHNILMKFIEAIKLELFTLSAISNPLSGYTHIYFKTKENKLIEMKIKKSNDDKKFITEINLINEIYEFLIPNQVYKKGILENVQWLENKKFVITPFRIKARDKPDLKSKAIAAYYRGMIIKPELRSKKEEMINNNKGHWIFANPGWVFSNNLIEYKDDMEFNNKDHFGTQKLMDKKAWDKVNKKNDRFCDRNEDSYKSKTGSLFWINENRLVKGYINWTKKNFNDRFGVIFTIMMNPGEDKSVFYGLGSLKNYEIENINNDLAKVHRDLSALEFNIPFAVYGRMELSLHCDYPHQDAKKPWPKSYASFRKFHIIEFDAGKDITIENVTWEGRPFTIIANKKKGEKYCKKNTMRLPTNAEIQVAWKNKEFNELQNKLKIHKIEETLLACDLNKPETSIAEIKKVENKESSASASKAKEISQAVKPTGEVINLKKTDTAHIRCVK